MPVHAVQVKPTTRVALRNDSYALHYILPSKVDPLVSLMKARGASEDSNAPSSLVRPLLTPFTSVPHSSPTPVRVRSKMCRTPPTIWSAASTSS